MSYRGTLCIPPYRGVAWLCLLAFVIVVRSSGIPLGRVQPEAVALVSGIMAIPCVILTTLAIGGSGIYGCFFSRKSTAPNLAK